VPDSEYWSRYYAVTVERPAWETVRFAIARFAAEDTGGSRSRYAVDLGCGAGRDARELLQAGWRVLAVDREPAATAMLEDVTPAGLRAALATRVADLATVAVPPCDLVNASLSLPFLPAEVFWETWARVLDALSPGGRVAAMLFGDRDDAAGDPDMTCPAPDAIRASLTAFEVEHWVDREEDGQTALGEAHHFHRVELVARRVVPRGVPAARPTASDLRARVVVDPPGAPQDPDAEGDHGQGP
jgi:SAM-dependent methyltransferase